MLYLLISVACDGFVFEKQWGGALLRVHTPTYAPFWASFANLLSLTRLERFFIMYSWHYIIIVQSRDLIHWGIYIRIIRLTYQRNREKGGRIGAAVACNRGVGTFALV